MTALGEMRERVAILQQSSTADGLGGQNPTWSTLLTMWGKVEPLEGRELYQAQAVTANLSYRITVPYYSSLTPLMRVSWAGKTLQIHGIINQSARDKRMVLECGETQ